MVLDSALEERIGRIVGSLTRRWRKKLRDRFDRLNRSERIAGVHLATDVGQFDEDHVTELFLCVIGDPDLGDIARHAHPLVVLRVLQVTWVRHRSS